MDSCQEYGRLEKGFSGSRGLHWAVELLMIKTDVSNLKSVFYLLQKGITAISESACTGDSFFICLDNNCLAGQNITAFTELYFPRRTT